MFWMRRHGHITTRWAAGLACSAAAAAALLLGGCASRGVPAGHAPKVMIVTMFAPEAQTWIEQLGPWRESPVAGLSHEYPSVRCNASDVCLVTTGMGHTNAAASMSALVLSKAFDLRKTYFVVAGIAGINPELGTIGSAAWARYLVDFGIQWELDAREIPPSWKSGYLGINTRHPDEKPPLDYRTEVFRLDEKLLQKAYALSRDITLSDGPQAQIARMKFPQAPANQGPKVIVCDTVAGDTWFSGTRLGQRATRWTEILTDGEGRYCTTQQEDNATYEVLKRGAAAGLVDLDRVAVVRAGSDFDRPYPGQSSVDNLLEYQSQGAFDIALRNLYLAAHPLVRAITTDWAHWKDGVPR